jgi:serralysin
MITLNKDVEWIVMLLLASIATVGACNLSSTSHAQGTPVPAGEVLANGGKGHVFKISRGGDGNKIIRDFNISLGQKIRLSGFGLASTRALMQITRQVGEDVVVELPDGQHLWLLKVALTDLAAEVFQLELDRTGLVQTFADEFDNFSWDSQGAVGVPVEKGVWRTNYGHGAPGARDSRTLASNKELEIYVDPGFRGTASKPLGIDPFRVIDGILQIVAKPSREEVRPYIWGFPYTSGLITTRGSFSQTYGVFEMRARLPKGQGLWPAFWLVPADGSWPPELDVMEVLGHDPTVLYTSWHSKETGVHTGDGVGTSVPDMSADFHVYSIEWDKEQIKWFFDGVEITRKSTPADMHKPMHVRANLAVGGSWPKNPDASTNFPAVFSIDWIRVYRREHYKQ